MINTLAPLSISIDASARPENERGEETHATVTLVDDERLDLFPVVRVRDVHAAAAQRIHGQAAAQRAHHADGHGHHLLRRGVHGAAGAVAD